MCIVLLEMALHLEAKACGVTLREAEMALIYFWVVVLYSKYKNDVLGNSRKLWGTLRSLWGCCGGAFTVIFPGEVEKILPVVITFLSRLDISC